MYTAHIKDKCCTMAIYKSQQQRNKNNKKETIKE